MNKTQALVSMRKIEPIIVALIIAIVFTGITVVASSAEKNPGWVNYDTKAALRINLQKVSPSKGNGVWMYDGNNDSYVNAIAKYNSGSSNKILYLFPYTGELNLQTLNLSYNTTRTNYYKSQLSIWTIKSHPGITRKNETVYPYNISDAAWSILKGFGSISVLVKCPNGSAITSGSVWLYNDNYQPVKKQNLNSNGQTTFSNLDPGIYILEVYFDDIFIGSKSVQ